jgi:hypothetical protein
MQISPKVYFVLYIAILVFLSIPALKLVGNVRIGQFFVLATFMLLLFDDISNAQLQYKVLLYFFVGTLIMSLVSFNSIEPKFGEMKFVTKYLLIFSASYYVGVRATQKLTFSKLILVMEIVAFVYCFNALIVGYGHLPQAILGKIVSYRMGWGGTLYLDYQGTFFEAGWLAMGVGSVTLVALLTRYELNLWPKNRVPFYLLYGFVLMTLGLSRNKTIWIALIVILLVFVIYKIYISLLHSNAYKPDHIKYDHAVLKLLSKIDVIKVLLGVLFFIILFFIINSSLSEPIITAEMLKEKLEKERGKVFILVIDLLRDSYFLGGYGFGFVEAYFTLIPQDVLGLGEGSAMIFNSYLDIWLSASILGLIFHFGLLYISTDNRYFVSMVIPFFYFIFANFNPATADESYYLFLGLSFSIATALTKRRQEICLKKLHL